MRLIHLSECNTQASAAGLLTVGLGHEDEAEDEACDCGEHGGGGDLDSRVFLPSPIAGIAVEGILAQFHSEHGSNLVDRDPCPHRIFKQAVRDSMLKHHIPLVASSHKARAKASKNKEVYKYEKGVDICGAPPCH